MLYVDCMSTAFHCMKTCNTLLKLDGLQLLKLVFTLLFQARVLLQALVKMELELRLFRIRIRPASCKCWLSVRSLS